MHSHDRHSRPRISKTLGKMLSRVYQIESLEHRTLLSADPVGAVAIVLAPQERESEVVIQSALPAGTNHEAAVETGTPWQNDAALPVSAISQLTPVPDWSVDQSLQGATQQERNACLDTVAQLAPQSTRLEVAFVDEQIDGWQALVASLGSHVEVHLIQAQQNGLQAMLDTLRGRTDLQAIHVLSHGSEGRQMLGGSVFSADSLDMTRNEWSQLGLSLAPDGDLLLYGCEVGRGEAGMQLLSSLAELTQADVAASDDTTGAAAMGGDWMLESQVGVVEAPSLFVADPAGYQGVLATLTGVQTTHVGTLTYASSIEINHATTISATGGVVFPSTVDALTGSTDSSLTVTAGATYSVTFNGDIGSAANSGGATLTGLTINARDVTFKGAVIIAGDVVLNVTNNIYFERGVEIRNGGSLTITGANNVSMTSTASIKLLGTSSPGVVGNITMVTDGVSFVNANANAISRGDNAGTGTFSIRPKSSGYTMQVASPTEQPLAGETGGQAPLDLSNDNLRAIKTADFGELVLGYKDGATSHADAAQAGIVRIGAMTTAFQKSVSVYGKSIIVSDLSLNPEMFLRVNGSLRLDAVNNIRITNEVGADGVTLYSSAGSITQTADAFDTLTQEALRTPTLTVDAMTGISLPWVEINTLDAYNRGLASAVADTLGDGHLRVHELAARNTPQTFSATIGGHLTVTRALQNDVASGALALSTANGDITVTSAGSGVVVNGPSSMALQAGGTGSLVLNKNLTLVNTGGTVTTKTMDLQAGGNITLASGITLNSNDGNIRLLAGGDIGLRTVNAGTGSVAVIATSGSITNANASTATNITAASLILDAGTAVGAGTSDSTHIQTVVNVLAARAGSGGLFVTESNALTVDQVNVLTKRITSVTAEAFSLSDGTATLEDLSTSSGGKLVLRLTAGNLTVNAGTTASAAITVAGAGQVSLYVPSGSLSVQGAIQGGSGNVTLLSSGSQTFGVGGDIQTTGGTIDLEATAASSVITMAYADSNSNNSVDATDAVTLFQTQGGAIRLNTSDASGGDITLGVLDARTATDRTNATLLAQSDATNPWGSVSVLSGAGSVLGAFSGSGGVNLYAKQARLSAAGSARAVGASNNAIRTELARLSAVSGTGGMFITESTDVSVGETAAVAVNRVGPMSGVAGSGNVSDAAMSQLNSGGVLVLQTLAGGVTTAAPTVSPAANTGTLTAAGNLVIKTAGASGHVVLNDTVKSTGGHISLLVSGNMTQNANIVTDTLGNTVDVQAAGTLTMAATATDQTTQGNIRVQSGGLMTLGVLDARSTADRNLPNGVADQATLWGRVSVTSTTASVVDVASNTATNVFAREARFTAGQAVGAIANRIEMDVVRVAAVVGSGGLYLQDTSALEVGSTAAVTVQRVDATGGQSANTDAVLSQIVSNAGAVHLYADGDIHIGLIDARTTAIRGTATPDTSDQGSWGQVTVVSSTGVVRDTDATNDTTVDIYAKGLRLQSQGAVGSAGSYVNTEASLLTVSTSAGSVFVQEASAVTVDTVDTQSDLTTGGNGSLVLVAGSAVTLNDGTGAGNTNGKAVSLNGSGSLLIEVLVGDLTINSDVLSGTGHITLKSAGAVNQGSATATGVDVSTASTGTISVRAEGGAMVMAGDATITATGSGLRLYAQDNITLGNVTATDVSLVSVAGGILNAAGSTKNISASHLRILADDAIGAATRSLTLAVGTVSASSAGTTSTGIFLTEDNAIVVDDVSVSVSEFQTDTTVSAVTDAVQSDLQTGQDGVIVLVAGGTVTLNDGTASADGVSVSAHGSGNVLVQAQGASSDVLVNADVQSTSGHVSVRAGKDVTLAAQGEIKTGTTGTVDVEAGAGSVTLTASSGLSSGSGAIRVLAGQDATISGVSTSGNVSVTATAGSVLDAGDTSVDVVAAGLRLWAGTDVGTAAQGLDVQIDTLAAQATAGGIYVQDVGDLTLGSVEVQVYRVGPNAEAEQSSTGVLAGISLTAANSALQLTVLGSVVLSGLNMAQSQVRVQAGLNITQASGETLVAKVLELTAGGSVGTASQALRTEVAELSANANRSTGVVYIQQSTNLSLRTVTANEVGLKLGGDVRTALSIGAPNIDTSALHYAGNNTDVPTDQLILVNLRDGLLNGVAPQGEQLAVQTIPGNRTLVTSVSSQGAVQKQLLINSQGQIAMKDTTVSSAHVWRMSDRPTPTEPAVTIQQPTVTNDTYTQTVPTVQTQISNRAAEIQAWRDAQSAISNSSSSTSSSSQTGSSSSGTSQEALNQRVLDLTSVLNDTQGLTSLLTKYGIPLSSSGSATSDFYFDLWAEHLTL